MNRLMLLLASVLALGAVACSGDPTPDSENVDESVPTLESATVEPTAVCPIMWYCQRTGGYYSVNTTCTAACGGTCYRRERYTGGCMPR